MKNLVVALTYFLLLFSCSKKQGENNSTFGQSVFSEADVKSNWVQLTEQKGEWIVFEPCEAANFTLQWKADTLIIDWGQEATADVITSIASEPNMFLSEGSDVHSDPPNHTFRVEPVDSLPGVARWWIMNEKEPRLMVKESLKDKYPFVKESCEGMFK